MPNITMKILRFYLAEINICMNKKDREDTKRTNDWFKHNGIDIAHIYAGEEELFQATMLVTNVLRDYGWLLEQNQAHVLQQFLRNTRCARKRLKIPIKRCYTIMNITKQVQRKSAKFFKAGNKTKAA